MSLSTTLGNFITDLTGNDTTPSPTPTPGQAYPALYAFGDSLSDVGNDYSLTAGIVPVSPPYYDGHFSNGPIWIEDLSQDLGLGAITPSLDGGTDFAYGGAQTGSTPTHTANPLDLNYQLTQFQAEDPHPDAGALYSVWIGSNDVLGVLNAGVTDPVADIDAAVSNEMSFISGLVKGGAQNLLVLTVPDIGMTPDSIAEGPAYMQDASNASLYYDYQLDTQLAQFAAANPVHITTVDMFSLLDSAIQNPAAFGLSNVTTPLWSGNFTDANSGTLAATDPAAQAGYLFWDGLHPTTTAHALIADTVYNHLAGLT